MGNNNSPTAAHFAAGARIIAPDEWKAALIRAAHPSSAGSAAHAKIYDLLSILSLPPEKREGCGGECDCCHQFYERTPCSQPLHMHASCYFLWSY